MDREIMYFHKFFNDREITIPINAIGLSYKNLLLAEKCPECLEKEIQECIDNIYKAKEDYLFSLE